MLQLSPHDFGHTKPFVHLPHNHHLRRTSLHHLYRLLETDLVYRCVIQAKSKRTMLRNPYSTLVRDPRHKDQAFGVYSERFERFHAQIGLHLKTMSSVVKPEHGDRPTASYSCQVCILKHLWVRSSSLPFLVLDTFSAYIWDLNLHMTSV